MLTIFFLFSAFGFFLFWYKRMHAKETAFTLATNACKRQQYQLLDESIGIAQTRLVREGCFFCLLRTFEFYYADEREQRQRGTIAQRGKEWLTVKFPASAAPVFHTELTSERKIIPFPGKYLS